MYDDKEHDKDQYREESVKTVTCFIAAAAATFLTVAIWAISQLVK